MNNTFRLIATIHRAQHPQLAKSVTSSKLTRFAGLVLALVLGYSGAAHAVLINTFNGPTTFAIHTGVNTAGATAMMSPDAPYPFIPDDLASNYNTEATVLVGNWL